MGRAAICRRWTLGPYIQNCVAIADPTHHVASGQATVWAIGYNLSDSTPRTTSRADVIVACPGYFSGVCVCRSGLLSPVVPRGSRCARNCRRLFRHC